MNLIPEGSFVMGDSTNEGWSFYLLPMHTVQVSSFYIDNNLVTKRLWDEVYTWAVAHGYDFDNAGLGKAANHPVHTVNWYDMTKWCNARSEKDGRVPAYYTDDTLSLVYRTGRLELHNEWVMWTTGYRLPTEAEWEKAARGGLTGKRFPWGDTITHDQANYYSSSQYDYDIGSARGFHSSYNDGVYPYTSPVGSFAPNGYGLYDMAGNVWEWCWDRYDDMYYSSSPNVDPHGPYSYPGLYRVCRGGGWNYFAFSCRVASRFLVSPEDTDNYNGFRSVLSSSGVMVNESISAESNPATVNTVNSIVKRSQTIAFPDLADKMVGDAPIMLQATASSGLPISYDIVSGAASVSGALLAVGVPGSVTVRASQPGDANYEAAYSVEHSFTVSSALTLLSNVRSAQRPGTFLVDVIYGLVHTNNATVTMLVSDNAGAAYAVVATNFTGDVGDNISPGMNKKITWDAGQDWLNRYSTNMRFRVIAQGAASEPTSMALIPEGSFTMGDTLNDGSWYEQPTHTVQVSAFYIDKFEVTKGLWDEVRIWAEAHGYSFKRLGSGKASDHPVHTVSWFDMLKWCNARSEKEGRIPAYYTDRAKVYRTGQVDVLGEWVKWNSGYRLPTEAEWEKAARGGTDGHRFAWSDVDTITQRQANYWSVFGFGSAYDLNPTHGYHPSYNDGVFPYTSPVGSFAPNDYGLYDMTGNMGEVCWDWYDNFYYNSSPEVDPRGPVSGSYRDRMIRGGCWAIYASYCLVAHRDNLIPAGGGDSAGFRSVLAPGGALAVLSDSSDSNLTTVDTRSSTTISITDAASMESSGELNFSIYLAQPTSQTITVHYATTNDTAIAGTNYEAVSGVLTFNPGQTNRTITVKIIDNLLSEPDRSMTMLLSDPKNAVLADGSGTGIIIDDDPKPQILINDSAAVPNNGKSSVTFNVSLTEISGQTIQIDYSTLNGTALAGRDYTATNGTLVFAPGQTNQSIVVTVLDTAIQGTRFFSVILANAVNVDIGDGEGIGSIIGNVPPEIRISDVRVKEGNSGLSNAVFPVALSRSRSQFVSVDYYTTNGTAIAGGDYLETHGTLVFNAEVTNGTIKVPIIGNLLNEPEKTFMVQLVNATNADIIIGLATGTIENDDPLPLVSVNDAIAVQSSGRWMAQFQVNLSAPSGQTIRLNYITTNGTAIAGIDYASTNGTLVFNPGQTNQGFVVSVLDNFPRRTAKVFNVLLTNAVNVAISDGTGVGTIASEPWPEIRISNYSTKEGNIGWSNAIFKVDLSVASSKPVTVDYYTTNGTAIAGKDYQETPWTTDVQIRRY